MKPVLLVAIAASLLIAGAATAQVYPAPDYLEFMPLSYPRGTNQTAASAGLHLYGNRDLPAMSTLRRATASLTSAGAR